MQHTPQITQIAGPSEYHSRLKSTNKITSMQHHARATKMRCKSYRCCSFSGETLENPPAIYFSPVILKLARLLREGKLSPPFACEPSRAAEKNSTWFAGDDHNLMRERGWFCASSFLFGVITVLRSVQGASRLEEIKSEIETCCFIRCFVSILVPAIVAECASCRRPLSHPPLSFPLR
jgi:hypothetical protein